MKRCLTTGLVALCLLPALAHAGRPHVHGIATLDIAVEARKISLQLESPLDNLLGFERAPRSDAERRQADALVARLKAAATLWRIDPAARCTLARVELASSALQLGRPDPAEEGHADIDASVEFDCVDAARAGWIDVGLFDYPHLQRIDVQVAAPQGEFRRDLKRPDRRIVLTR